MSDFKQFQRDVKAQGGIWATEDIYFSQFRDFYSASYQPQYPHITENDKTINSNDYDWINRKTLKMDIETIKRKLQEHHIRYDVVANTTIRMTMTPFE